MPHGDRPGPGSLADLRRRLEQLPAGHPSSPYHEDGTRRPPVARLKNLELPLPGEQRDGYSLPKPDPPRLAAVAAAMPTVEAHQRNGEAAPDWSADQGSRPAWEQRPPSGDADAADHGTDGTNGTADATADNADQDNADHDNADQDNADQDNADHDNADHDNADQETADDTARHADDAADITAYGTSDAPALGADDTADATARYADDTADATARYADATARYADATARYADATAEATGYSADDTADMIAYNEDEDDTADDTARHADDTADITAYGTSDAPALGADGSWEWRGRRLTPEQAAVADHALAYFRRAEGRTVFDSYGAAGLTPAMRRVEAQLEHGRLMPDTEKFALKSPDRFKEKLAGLITRNPGKSANELAREIPDAIRYTFIFNTERYTESAILLHSRLRNHGFYPEGRRNSWQNSECKGIITSWRDPAHNLLFEVQFHTPESWDVRQRTQGMYEKIMDPRLPASQRAALRSLLADSSAAIPVPPGCTDIPDLRKDGQ